MQVPFQFELEHDPHHVMLDAFLDSDAKNCDSLAPLQRLTGHLVNVGPVSQGSGTASLRQVTVDGVHRNTKPYLH